MQAAKNRTPQDTLPARLQQLLDSLTNRTLAARLDRVYRAAAIATDRLGHLSLVKYEPTSASGSADLGLWEKMAPAIRDTVVDVNALVTAIHEDFPLPPPPSVEEGWELPPASLDERLAQEVEVVLHACASRLSRRVADLGQRVRRPEVVSDAWALLSELQVFRADFRAQVGDLVYLTASAFGEVRREDVVPGYALQLKTQVALRGALVDLRRTLKSRLERAAAAPPQETVGMVKRLAETLGAYLGMPTALAMKARDKRPLLEAREQLEALATQGVPSAEPLVQRVQPLLTLLERVLHELNQSVLPAHDRALWMTCTARLEQASLHLFLGSVGAERVLRESLQLAESLYGRSEGLDALLRKVRAAPEVALAEPELRETLEMFRERLATLPFN